MPLPVLQGVRVTLRPITDADLDALVAIMQSPGVRERWWEADDPERMRAGFREGVDSSFAIEVDGAPGGADAGASPSARRPGTGAPFAPTSASASSPSAFSAATSATLTARAFT